MSYFLWYISIFGITIVIINRYCTYNILSITPAAKNIYYKFTKDTYNIIADKTKKYLKTNNNNGIISVSD